MYPPTIHVRVWLYEYKLCLLTIWRLFLECTLHPYLGFAFSSFNMLLGWWSGQIARSTGTELIVVQCVSVFYAWLKHRVRFNSCWVCL